MMCSASQILASNPILALSTFNEARRELDRCSFEFDGKLSRPCLLLAILTRSCVGCIGGRLAILTDGGMFLD